MPGTLCVSSLQDVCLRRFCLHLSELSISSDLVLAGQTTGQGARNNRGQDSEQAAGQGARNNRGQDSEQAAGQGARNNRGQDSEQAAGQGARNNRGQDSEQAAGQGAGQEAGQEAGEEAGHDCGTETEHVARQEARQEAVPVAVHTRQEAERAAGQEVNQEAVEEAGQYTVEDPGQVARSYLLHNVPPCFFEQLVHDTLTIVNKHFYNPRYKSRRPAMVAVAGWLLGDHVRHLSLDQCRMLCDRVAVPRVFRCLRHMPRLQTLAIGRLNFWKIPELGLLADLLACLPQLTTLRLEYICLPEMVAGLADKCPRLQELSLKDSEKITDREVPEIMRCQRLRSLNISGTSVTGAGSWDILRTLPSLTWFEHCPFNCNSGPFLFDSREAMLSYIWDFLSPGGRVHSAELPSVAREMALPSRRAEPARPAAVAEEAAEGSAGTAPGAVAEEVPRRAGGAGSEVESGAGPERSAEEAPGTVAEEVPRRAGGAGSEAESGAGPERSAEEAPGTVAEEVPRRAGGAGSEAESGAGPERSAEEAPGTVAEADREAAAGELVGDATADGRGGQHPSEAAERPELAAAAGQQPDQAADGGVNGHPAAAAGTDGATGTAADTSSEEQVVGNGEAAPSRESSVGTDRSSASSSGRRVSPLALSRSSSGSATPRPLRIENFWLFNPKTEEVALARLCPVVRLVRLDFVFQDMGRSPDLAGLVHLQHVTRLEINSFDAPRFSVLSEVLRQLGGQLTELALHVCDDYTATATLENAVARWCPRLERYAFTGDYSVRLPAERGDDDLDFTALRRRHPVLRELTLGGFVTGRRLLFLLAHASGLRRLRLDGELRHLWDDGFRQLLAANRLRQLEELWVNVSSGLTLQAVLPLLFDPDCQLRRLGRLSSLQGLNRARFLELRDQVRAQNLAVDLVWVTPGV